MNWVKISFADIPGLEITDEVEKWRKEVEDLLNAEIMEALNDAAVYGTGVIMTATEVIQRQKEGLKRMTDFSERWLECSYTRIKKKL
jgi:hypothetical protein